MKLDEYLFRTKQTRREFAKKIGITANYMSQIVTGRRKPSANIAKKIEDETNGKVTLMELLFPKKS